MKPITGLDATFLYAETPNSPMHVGSVLVLEGSLEYETFRKLILSRIHHVPTFRKRLVQVPFSIDYPYWVDDPHFDIDMHMNHIALPKPGGWSELREVASSIFSEPLDRSRPLWSFTFVEGLDTLSQVPAGSVAVISKIHHVAIDGAAGAGILALMFDMSPKVKEIPAPKPYEPEPMPNEMEMIYKSTLSFASKPLKLSGILRDTLKATLKTGFLSRVQHIELPTAPFSAPASPLNGIISPRRKWNTTILSLDRVKKLKNVMDMTLNDILLGICSGALRRYLLEKEKLPRKSLVAMVPVSTRSADGKSKGQGNQISSMLVQLATHIEDPMERLVAINENTHREKTYNGAMGAKTLGKMAELVPFGIANQAARIYSRFHMAEMHKPVFNVTITNVPGPQFPLYLNGHQMVNMMGMAPIIDGMGLIITIFSYNGSITVSPTSDARTMPDIDVFTRYLRESANELEEMVLKFEKEKKRKAKKESEPQSDILFKHIQDHLTLNPELVSEKAGLFQFHVEGPAPSNWYLDFHTPPGTVVKGEIANPDAVFIIRDDHLMRIGRGELDLQTAVVQGRLAVEGDINQALELNKVLDKIPKLV